MTTTSYPILPLRDGVLLPGTVATIPVGRPSSVALVTTVGQGSTIVVAVQRDPSIVEPTLADLHDIAVIARIQKVTRLPRGYQVVLEAKERVRLNEITKMQPYLVADCTVLETTNNTSPETLEAFAGLQIELKELEERASGALQRVIEKLADIKAPGALADQTAAALGLSVVKEVPILLELDAHKRLRRVLELVVEARTTGELKEKIDDEVRKEFHRHQKEAILREQLKVIQKELGDKDGPEGDADRLRERLDKADLPDDVRKVAERELSRLKGGTSGPEQGVIRNYLDWILDLPWKVRVEAKGTIDEVEKKLDDDHTGLLEPKKRILEQLAVMQMTGNAKSTILCLVGPPGVGKTSLGQSIADALGRPFARVAFGGVRDEAEVRGHRRTYVGAIPGRIMHALKKAGAKNPVFLLDEIDKLGKGWAGDPEAALLEVLDPEQNGTFTDHYMELPFDLSEVLFVCTANELDKISGPLRDRLEIIDIEGYTIEEKLSIAQRHLIPKKIADHGLQPELIEWDADTLRDIISGYTREAGVRQLQREITKVCRTVALKMARAGDSKPQPLKVTRDVLRDLLGKPKFFDEKAERMTVPGVAIGLAWTPVGGDILFIESTRMPGKGNIEITGQLGDVMKESARAAMSFVRSRADVLGIDPKFLEGSDIHIHIPAGGIPKDGPSAGVTLFTAIVSLLSGKKVNHNIAMTGEATLRGRVLPVGGIKSKVLAAHRAGITKVLLPAQNQRDVDDIPEEVRSALEIVLVSDMQEVLQHALEGGLPMTPHVSGEVSAGSLPSTMS